MKDVSKAFRNVKLTIPLLIDLCKALAFIQHKVLLAKLEYYGKHFSKTEICRL